MRGCRGCAAQTEVSHRQHGTFKNHPRVTRVGGIPRQLFVDELF
jgi:hypothetical protein